MAALGQMPQARGPPPRIEGSVALVPQAPFVLAGSVRDNILFGLPYEEGGRGAGARGVTPVKAWVRADLGFGVGNRRRGWRVRSGRLG
jgi:ABC-type transport system involved in cytochrome bd biosynthesis fused ATPase/permease subunit